MWTLREESKLFQAIVINDTPVYLALDADARKKQNHLVKLFSKYDVDLKVIDTSNSQDVGSMSKSEFSSRKSSACEPDTNEDLLISILSNL